MEIIYGLSALWAAGCVIAPLVGTYYLWQDDGRWMAALFFAIGLPVGAVLAVLPWWAIAGTKSPDLATLKKGQWACTASRLETTMMPVSTGKTTMLVPTTYSVCVTYSKLR